MRQADTDVTSEDGNESQAGTAEWVGELLGEWQPAELRIARGFAECRGLATEQLEDIYQETALALLNRPYGSEEHLRNALRHGIKHRALNVHRDTRRRTQILHQSAPSMQRVAEARESQAGPQEAALGEQDRLIVREFLTELDELEQQVFWLIADGMRYRAIAPILGVAVNVARNASRSCERKRERFQLLYDTGRLCGYRAATIRAIQAGELTSEEIAARAFAHLEACVSCRTEHKTNAKRLGRSFRDQLAALLPVPALLDRLEWLRSPWLHSAGHLGGALRHRATAMIGAGGAGAKLTASVATVAVIAGGTAGATHVLDGHATPARRHMTAAVTTAVPAPITRSSVSHSDTVHRSSTRDARRSAHRSVYVAAAEPHAVSSDAVPVPEKPGREFSLEAEHGHFGSTQVEPSNSSGARGGDPNREFMTPSASG
jgi:RNA polymerase sigma factor (sigma-70 family)